MKLEYLMFWFKWKKIIIPAAILLSISVGYASVYVVEDTVAPVESATRGSLRTVLLPGLQETGCVDDCQNYNLETMWRSRPSKFSQLTPLVGAPRSMYQDAYIHHGYGGVLATAEGTLIADLVKEEAAWANIAGRITSGIGADFNNDGYNEFLFGLASHNPAGWTDDQSKRYRRSLEMVAPYSEDSDKYKSITEYAMPRTFCAYPCSNPDGTPVAAEWAIDGDVTDVTVGDFNDDGWLDIAYLGVSAGDHSWLGFAEFVSPAAARSNQNGTRVGVYLNKGLAAPGQFEWSSRTSPLESYIRRLYPVDPSVNYAVKTHQISSMDLDGDGHMDLLVTGENLIIAWGDGSGNFVNIETLAETPGGTRSAVADFNNDGALDIAVYANLETVYSQGGAEKNCSSANKCREKGANKAGKSALYLGKGARKYENSHTFFGAADPTSITSLDINNDGWLDMVLTCSLCEGPVLETAVVENGKLVRYTTGPLSTEQSVSGLENAAVIDLDLDGDMDILFTGRRAAFRQIWVNPAEKTPTKWLKLKIVGHASIVGDKGSAIKPLGMTVTVTGEFGVKSAIVQPSSNYVYFNLGPMTLSAVDSVSLRWQYQEGVVAFTNVPVNTTTLIAEKDPES